MGLQMLRFSVSALAGGVLIGITAASAAAQVRISGDPAATGLILQYIRAAENGNRRLFDKMTERSVIAEFAPPKIDDVDRRDEGCELKSLDGSMLKIVSAVWECPGRNVKPVVQRSFLIEHGKITHIWNDWSEVSIGPRLSTKRR
ncbi:hypothetical protein NED98_20155 [Sphingomonas sp. MMSM20]|uniref:hypothetical protein n=1 Tax=Sphingomonas lycopersici TaxID=2951807 RepID=UPI0022381BCA|nr:hypothetical protein [Sphingomonas lycopersici]MCW6532567.1 hypothetical protein [Sphingomonas lycopersici]